MMTNDGYLVAMGPRPTRPRLVVAGREEPRKAGHIKRPVGLFRRADRVLRRACESGPFILTQRDTFHCLWHAPSLRNLLGHIRENWTDASIDVGARQRIRGLLRRMPGARLLVDHLVGVTVLRKRR
ncbi:MAG: hypothetical protein HY660_10260 [Armatimonadetes bacterium]|nr:hypothetical protein [Armatimonadota bacterium]